MKRKKRRFTFSTSQLILLSFLMAILAGSVLLALPISAANGHAVPYVDALFTAATATCVTGLVTLPTVTTWSLFGQTVILVLIQIGGLGVITILTGLMIALQKRVGLSQRILIQDAFNLNTLSGLARFVKKVIAGTFLIEGIGALCYMAVFVPRFGPKGIWVSVFTSISAFCNAGIDIISEGSLCEYVHHPAVNLITCLLIVSGGIGFIVWWDLIRVWKMRRQGISGGLKRLTLHSKIALFSTAFLIIAGAVSFFIFEYNNPLTMRDYSLFEKIQASLFQSVTTRTAGFATIPQENLTNASSLISILLMFTGGSPAGTAGGVKTVTLAVLIAFAVSSIRGKNDAALFHRSIPGHAVGKAAAVVTLSFATMFLSSVLLSAFMDADVLSIVYEAASATATVGLTRNLTPCLNFPGKLIITATMYLGRVGPISLAASFKTRLSAPDLVKNPVEEISVG